MRLLKDQSGFTLLEIMLSTIILVAALIPVLNLYSSGFVGSEDAEIVTKSLNLARGKMEEVKGLGYFVPLGEETLAFGEFNLEKVNLLLSKESLESEDNFISWFSEPNLEPEKIRTVVQVEYVDENNQPSFLETNLKRVTVTTFAKEKSREITKKTEMVSLISKI